MPAPRESRRCWFCGQRHLVDGDPPEHIIPAAPGAELTTDAVAKDCNERAGKEIDSRLLADPFVAFNRVFYDIRERRGRRPPNPARNATLTDGTPVTVETREIPWRTTRMPTIRQEGERMTLTVSSVEEAEEIIAKKSERSGQKYKVVGERRYRDDSEIEIPVEVDLRLRIRARSKMVLGVLSKVFPDSWLDCDEAKQLQEWLWDPRPKLDGQEIHAMHAAVEGLLSFVCQPPEHLVALMPGGVDRIQVMVVLFGSELIPYEVSLPDIEAPEDCWVIDPKKRKVRHMQWMEQVQEIGWRLDQNRQEAKEAN